MSRLYNNFILPPSHWIIHTHRGVENAVRGKRGPSKSIYILSFSTIIKSLWRNKKNDYVVERCSLWYCPDLLFLSRVRSRRLFPCRSWGFPWIGCSTSSWKCAPLRRLLSSVRISRPSLLREGWFRSWKRESVMIFMWKEI